MALLLRMGGVPARVAAGFTSGTYNSATGQWDVTDIDAHAWVEVWFPDYGWVRFDPTPAVAPARGGVTAPGLAKILNGGNGSLPTPVTHGNGSTNAASTSNRHGSGSGITPLLIVPVLAILVRARTAGADAAARRHRTPTICWRSSSGRSPARGRPLHDADDARGARAPVP